MKIYADASFLISLYSLDANSAIAGQTMRASSGERYVTVFGELEVVNALHLRVFRKELSGSQVQSSLSNFETDRRDGIFLLRFQSKSLNGLANYLEQPRLAWGRAPRTCCTPLRPSNLLRTTSTASISSNENSRERSDSRSTKT